jgi:hypothetical protein
MGQTRKAKGRLNEFERLLIARRRALDLPSRFSQWGGVRRQGIVSANGFQYNYDEDYEAEAYTIHAARPRRKTECFLLFVNKDKTAELHSMRHSKDCSLQDNASSQNLLHAAVALAKDKGATRIELTDVANKHLPYNKSFRLSNMYFLTSGRTWFETHGGFQPIAADKKDVDQWRHQALTTRWNNVLKCLRKRYPAFTIPVDTADIDGSAEGSAMAVFHRIKEAHTDFFATYDRTLMLCSKIGPLESIVWYADL